MYSLEVAFILKVDNVDILIFAQSYNVWALAKSIREPPILIGIVRVVNIILESKYFVEWIFRENRDVIVHTGPRLRVENVGFVVKGRLRRCRLFKDPIVDFGWPILLQTP